MAQRSKLPEHLGIRNKIHAWEMRSDRKQWSNRKRRRQAKAEIRAALRADLEHKRSVLE